VLGIFMLTMACSLQAVFAAVQVLEIGINRSKLSAESEVTREKSSQRSRAGDFI